MKPRANLGWIFTGVIAALMLAALWTAPLLWAINTALRPGHEAVPALYHWLTQDWTLAVLRRLLAAGKAGRWLFDSALVALMVTLLTLALSLTAAYAFSQLRFRGRSLVFALAMLPFVVWLAPLFRMTEQLGPLDSYAGIFLSQFVAPVVIYVFKQFFDEMPSDLREAAVLDGAGPLRILWSVYLPVAGKIVWAMAILSFIGAWNIFLSPFIISLDDMTTIAPGLTQASDAFGVRYTHLMAGALIGALAYALFQRRVPHGFLAATGLKG